MSDEIKKAITEDLNETNAALRAQLADLQSLADEEKRLEIEERKLNVELKRRDVAVMQQARADRLSRIELAANQLRAQLQAQEALQAQCTHMKGGTVKQGDSSVVMNGHGTDSGDYCIIKHVLPSGALFILCQRCLKEWRSRDPLTGEPETPGFKEASRWPTKNGTSGSSQFWPVRSYPEQVAVR